ncbi:MAG: hypothetical protein SFZ23_02265 [Planctomycetota bacterium]|nr:hypothetical protein [Planctomycetota bacterium]
MKTSHFRRGLAATCLTFLTLAVLAGCQGSDATPPAYATYVPGSLIGSGDAAGFAVYEASASVMAAHGVERVSDVR